MKYHLLIRPEAEADIEESFNWYEAECPGLGQEFRKALRHTVARIRSSPQSFPLVHRQIRRALVNRFPHAFFYFLADKTIVVTACIHHKRDPKIWKRRN
ncbi:MAG: type II toxin-antitoxin system RelE/ParE family toxin [Pyrinomonadaceae bacterium]